jgi:hypothetical protein
MMLLQWKKKTEKMKAHTLFKAAASIAKLSTQFNNNGDADHVEVEGGHGQRATEEALLRDKDGAADMEEEEES